MNGGAWILLSGLKAIGSTTTKILRFVNVTNANHGDTNRAFGNGKTPATARPAANIVVGA